MEREEYELISDLVNGDEDWMQQVGIQNPDDLVERLDPAGFTPEQAIIAQSVDPACWNAEECEIMNPTPKRNPDPGGPAIFV